MQLLFPVTLFSVLSASHLFSHCHPLYFCTSDIRAFIFAIVLMTVTFAPFEHRLLIKLSSVQLGVPRPSGC